MLKLIRNLLLLTALILGFVFIRHKFFSKHEEETKTEHVMDNQNDATEIKDEQAPAADQTNPQ